MDEEKNNFNIDFPSMVMIGIALGIDSQQKLFLFICNKMILVWTLNFELVNILHIQPWWSQLGPSETRDLRCGGQGTDWEKCNLILTFVG